METLSQLMNKGAQAAPNETDVEKLQAQVRAQAQEIVFLRQRQEQMRQIADAAARERDELRTQLQQYMHGGHEDLKARNAELQAEVSQLRLELASTSGNVSHARGLSPSPRPGSASSITAPRPPELLGVGRRLSGRRSSIGSAASRLSASSSQSRSESVERLLDEKHRTEVLIAKTTAARDATPPRERQKLDAIMGKLGKLHAGLEDKLFDAISAPNSRSSSRPSSRPTTPRGTAVTESEIAREQARVQQLQEKLRASSPHMSREDRERMETLMMQLHTTHNGLSSRAQRLRERGMAPADPEL